MGKIQPPFYNMPPLALWLFFLGAIFGIVPLAVNGFAEMLHGSSPLASWQTYVSQDIAFLFWGIAFLLTSVVLRRREPQPSLSLQPLLWVGLFFLALIPDGAMLALQSSHLLSEGPVTVGVILISIIASLCCLGLAVSFSWRKRRRETR